VCAYLGEITIVINKVKVSHRCVAIENQTKGRSCDQPKNFSSSISISNSFQKIFVNLKNIFTPGLRFVVTFLIASVGTLTYIYMIGLLGSELAIELHLTLLLLGYVASRIADFKWSKWVGTKIILIINVLALVIMCIHLFDIIINENDYFRQTM
jgi:hypothetical protein